MRPINIPKAELEKLYLDKKWNQYEIAEKYGCSQATVRTYLLKYGIPLRSKTLAQKMRNLDPKKRNQGKPGELNANYKHGVYIRERIYREMIEIGECNRCGAKDNLVVHHKNNDHLDNHLDNLEVLCRSCHHSHHMKQRWAMVRELAS